jgi:hypothetical protein
LALNKASSKNADTIPLEEVAIMTYQISIFRALCSAVICSFWMRQLALGAPIKSQLPICTPVSPNLGYVWSLDGVLPCPYNFEVDYSHSEFLFVGPPVPADTTQSDPGLVRWQAKVEQEYQDCIGTRYDLTLLAICNLEKGFALEEYESKLPTSRLSMYMPDISNCRLVPEQPTHRPYLLQQALRNYQICNWHVSGISFNVLNMSHRCSLKMKTEMNMYRSKIFQLTQSETNSFA